MKYLLKSSFLFAILVIGMTDENVCSCRNNRTCINESYCDCGEQFVGVKCQLKATKLKEDTFHEITLNSENQYLYYQHKSPNDTFDNIAICVNKTFADVQVVIQAVAEQPDNQVMQKKRNILQRSFKNGECWGYGLLVMDIKEKQNGQLPKIVIMLKQKHLNKQQETIGENTIVSVKVNIIDLDIPLSEFRILAMMMSIMVLLMLFSLCYIAIKIMKFRRRRRMFMFAFHAAEPIPQDNDISHLDVLSPLVPYSSDFGLQQQQQDCAICLVGFQQNDQVRKITCGHLFHGDCIDSWAVKKLNCPSCRCSLALEDNLQGILSRGQIELQ